MDGDIVWSAMGVLFLVATMQVLAWKRIDCIHCPLEVRSGPDDIDIYLYTIGTYCRIC